MKSLDSNLEVTSLSSEEHLVLTEVNELANGNVQTALDFTQINAAVMRSDVQVLVDALVGKGFLKKFEPVRATEVGLDNHYCITQEGLEALEA